MTLHKLTAGDGYTYLTRQVVAHDVTQRGYDSLGDYYAEKGESPGVWMGSGCYALPQFLGGRVSEEQMVALFGEGRHPDAVRIEADLRAQGSGQPAVLAATRLGSPFAVHNGVNEFRRLTAESFAEHNAAMGLPRDWALPADERAAIRTEVARDLFAKEYGREAADPRELSGFLARISRQATTAVAGYDLTFSPVKSVSALWALAPREVAEVIETAHADAVKDTLSWLESTATYTRTGRAGVQQVEVTGLIAAAFTHRDSRAGDPDLHTHVAISNKVQARSDGRWLALDGRPLHRMTVAASERYNTRIETLLRQRLGVQFDERAGQESGKRPVREIVGIDSSVTSRWSQRRAQIDTRRAQLAADFQTTHGRPPTTVEALALAQQANLETRQGKHAPRSHADQRATWRAEAEAALGGSDRVQAMLDQLLRRHPHRGMSLSPEWAAQAAADVLATVQTGRATWQECHVRAEAERHLRAVNICPDQVDAGVEAIVTAALGPDRSIPLGTPEPVSEPSELRRSDGTSVYATVGTQLYTSAQILADEQRLLAHARTPGGRVITDSAVDIALVESAANGVELNPGQVQLVRELARAGATVQLALAPAGTGKTTATRVLTSAWHTPDEHGRPGHVVGLAPSAAAAAVLREEIGVHTDTLAKLIHTIDHPEQSVPGWVHAIGPDTLVIVDEAGMAATSDLARAVDWIASRGGAVRLIGDDQQLAAIGAGGVLRDIAHQVGAVHLSQVMRFTDPAEGAASLALRAGDPAAIGYYIDHHRVHVGDQSTVADTAYSAWADDRAAGRDSVMIAPTRDLVATLNARARTDRLAAEPHAAEPAVALADGSHASAGDVIITRNNDRRLPITQTDFVKNGDRWTIATVHANGALTAQHHGTRRRVRLPAGYVAEHVALGYAATVHAAQGITADTSHLVATGDESRQLLYVAMTRGRTGNHVYLTTAGDGDPHSVITRDALIPPTAVDIMTRILARDGSQVSATSTARDLDATPARLRTAAARYHDALQVAAETHLGPDGLAQLAATAERVVPGATAAESWHALRAHLALIALDGTNPEQALRVAAAQRDLTGSRDIAAVLDWRLDPTRQRGHTGPLPWLPGVPQRLVDDPHWGDYLSLRANLTTELAEQAHAEAATWTPTTAPAWTIGLLDTDPALAREIAVWRAAIGVGDTDRDPAGPRPLPAAEARQHQQLLDRVHAALGRPDSATNRFATVVTAIDPRITSDPYWPQLAERLDAARRAGISITDLVGTVTDPKTGAAPLPDEYPAAALWWRICRHLSPAALTGDHATVSTLRPGWTDDLHRILGHVVADRVVEDPAWPALVAAVTTAREHGWDPEQLLASAYELLDSGHPADDQLRDDELATALVWRVGLLTDPTHAYPASGADQSITEADPSQLDLDHDVPEDLHHHADCASPDSAEDEDWVASLVRLDPVEEPAEPVPDPVDDPAPHAADPVVRVTADAERGVHADTLYSHPTRSGVLRERLLELNTQAHAYYESQYDKSWAPAYLAERIGSDLAEQARELYAPGYAPDRWTALADHLRRLGADDTELLAAGLAVRASTGRLIDRFRDRLIMPIWHQDELQGFIGRRNPAKTDDDKAGPKYVNTAETDLYCKGAQLYGLHEARHILAAGATPVLVEGPLDAWAVTLVGDAQFVGVTPLGTAFTNQQADRLRPYIGDTKRGVLVATDNDAAGRKAAQRAYWQLASRGDAPRRPNLPTNMDPADLLRTRGPQALRTALDQAPSLASVLIDTTIDRYAGRLDTIEGRVAASRAAADIVGALRPDEWLGHIKHIQTRLDLMPGSVHFAVLDAGHAWSQDPHAETKRHIAAHPPDASPAIRWAELGRTIRPDLITGRDWEPLATALDRAHADGYDITGRLLDLAAAEALPYRNAARELQARLIAECDAAQNLDSHTLQIEHADAPPRHHVRIAAENVQTDNRLTPQALPRAARPPAHLPRTTTTVPLELNRRPEPTQSNPR